MSDSFRKDIIKAIKELTNNGKHKEAQELYSIYFQNK